MCVSFWSLLVLLVTNKQTNITNKLVDIAVHYSFITASVK